MAIVIVVVVISAHSSDSSCPLARETIYQNAGGRPLSQTIRNRYRSHYHFIAEILGRVMVPQREREREIVKPFPFVYVIHLLVIRIRISSSSPSFLFLFPSRSSKRRSLNLREIGSLKSIHYNVNTGYSFGRIRSRVEPKIRNLHADRPFYK